MRAHVLAGQIALYLLYLLLPARPGFAALLEYLYVEPNAGAAAAGHVALRLGDEAYHYQNVGGDSLRLSRVHFEHFRYVYSVLQNRTIHVGSVDLRDADWERLRDRFEARHLSQERHFALQAALQGDRELLNLIAAGEGALSLAGVGFFPNPASPAANPDGVANGAGDDALEALRARIHGARGAHFLRQRIEALERQIHALSPDAGAGALPVVSRDAFPITPYTFSERFADLTSERSALLAIAEGRPLAGRWRMSGPSPELALTSVESTSLAAFRTRLESGVVALLDSRRPDRGRAMLLSLARIVVLQESQRTGQLVVLDAFPQHTLAIPADAGPRTEFVEELSVEARRVLRRVRSRMPAADEPGGEPDEPGEPDELGEPFYSELEDAANRFIEFQRGVRDGGDVRVHGEHLVPEGRGELVDPLLPRLAAGVAATALTRADARAETQAASLREVYGYNLITRNCVTALFDTIDPTATTQTPAQLAGRAAPGSLLAFIPSLSFRAVKRHWQLDRVGEIPSFRLTRVEALGKEKSSALARLGVYLRESNTLSSTSYRANERDPFFLFFTDQAPWIRPLYGAANLAVGIGESALGLLRLPFDSGARLKSAARGAFFSLPELVFINIRKGSFDYARSEAPRTAWRAAASGR